MNTHLVDRARHEVDRRSETGHAGGRQALAPLRRVRIKHHVEKGRFFPHALARRRNAHRGEARGARRDDGARAQLRGRVGARRRRPRRQRRRRVTDVRRRKRAALPRARVPPAPPVAVARRERDDVTLHERQLVRVLGVVVEERRSGAERGLSAWSADIVKDVRGSESNCEQDSRTM